MCGSMVVIQSATAEIRRGKKKRKKKKNKLQDKNIMSASATQGGSSSRRQPNFVALNRGRHLHSAGPPSRWVFAHTSSWLWYCSDVGERRSTKLCTMFGLLLADARISSGTLPRNGILPGAKFTLRPNLLFFYIGSVTARHSSTGHQSKFVTSYKERN